MATAGTPALKQLLAAGIDHSVHTYDHDPAAPSFGEEAAQKLGVEGDRVFKTLIASVDGQLTVAIVPVTCRLDLKRLAQAVGGKRAEMADPKLAERSTGYVLGAISPVGQKRPLPTVIDETAELFDTMFCSAGRRGMEIEIAPRDLRHITGGSFAPISH